MASPSRRVIRVPCPLCNPKDFRGLCRDGDGGSCYCGGKGYAEAIVVVVGFSEG